MPRLNSTGEHGAQAMMNIDSLGGRSFKVGEEIPAEWLLDNVPLRNRLALEGAGRITFFDIPGSVRDEEQDQADQITALSERVEALTDDKGKMKKAIVALETQVNKLMAANGKTPARRRAPAKKTQARKTAARKGK